MLTNKPKQLVSNTFFNILNLGVNILTAFFLTPFVIHSLGDRMYGVWTLVGTFIGYYGFLDLGVSSAVSRYLTKSIGEKQPENINVVASTALILFTGISLIGLIVTFIGVILCPLFVANKSDIVTFQIIFSLLGVSVSISFTSRVFGGVLFAYLRSDLCFIVQIITCLLRVALTYQVLLLGYKLIAIASVTFFISLLDNALVILISLKLFPHITYFGRYFNKETVKSLLSYGSYTIISQLADILRFNVDNLVITIYLGVACVTPYSIAFQIIRYFTFIVGAVSSAMKPVFSIYDGANDYESIREKYIFGMKLTSTFALFLGINMILYGNPFIVRWVGKEYENSYIVLVILAIVFTYELMQSQGIGVMYSLSKHKYLAYLNIGEGIGNLVLSIILAKKFGIYGVALGTAIPMFIAKTFFQPLYVCKIIQLPVLHYIKPLVISLSVSILICLGYYMLIKPYIIPDYLRLLMIGGGISIIFFPLAYVTIFNDTEKEYLRKGLMFIR